MLLYEDEKQIATLERFHIEHLANVGNTFSRANLKRINTTQKYSIYFIYKKIMRYNIVQKREPGWFNELDRWI